MYHIAPTCVDGLKRRPSALVYNNHYTLLCHNANRKQYNCLEKDDKPV